MTDTAPQFPPCSDCAEGNHGPCTRPFCGCNQAGHTLGPVVAPIGEVLDAATRAPASAEAEAQAEVAAAPAPAAPTLPPPVDPMGMVDPAAVGDALATQLALVIDPPLDIPATTGQVGLVDLPLTESAETTLDAAEAQIESQPASEAQRATHDPQAALLVMAAPRDPSLHVSIWDGPRKVHPSIVPLDDGVPDEQALIDAMEADLASTGNDGPSFAEQAALVANDAAHAYGGDPDAPYRCTCGTDPGTLNKLGSHLGITGDADAMAELGKQSVPNVVAHKARERAAKEADAAPASEVLPHAAPAAEPPAEVNPATDPAFLAALREAIDADPAMTDVLIEQNAAELAAQGALTPDPTAPIEATATETPPGYLPPLGPSDELDGPGLLGPTHGHVTQDELHAANGAPPAPAPAQSEAETLAARLRSAIAEDAFLDELLPDGEMGPYRLLIVNGADGWVHEALYGGSDIHPAVADEILEHFGFDPTPLDAEGGTSLTTDAMAQVTEQPPEMRSMSVLPAARPQNPTRVQVARLTTACAECTVPIEPGDLIGFKQGLGTVHATHGE